VNYTPCNGLECLLSFLSASANVYCESWTRRCAKNVPEYVVGVDEVLRSVVHEYVLARARVFILEFRRLSYTIVCYSYAGTCEAASICV